MIWITTYDRDDKRVYVTAEGYLVQGQGQGHMSWKLSYKDEEIAVTDAMREARTGAEWMNLCAQRSGISGQFSISMYLPGYEKPMYSLTHKGENIGTGWAGSLAETRDLCDRLNYEA